jgi:hypothetical protein
LDRLFLPIIDILEAIEPIPVMFLATDTLKQTSKLWIPMPIKMKPDSMGIKEEDVPSKLSVGKNKKYHNN